MTANARQSRLLRSVTAAWLVVAAVRVTAAAERDPSTWLRLNDGRLSARIRGTPLPDVLGEVGRLAGAAVDWRGTDSSQTVAMEFADLPLSDAIARLLGWR